MYEDKKNFSFKDAIVQLLLVVLFVFILIWLFPTKGYLADKFASKDYVDNALNEKLRVLYGRVYADNVETMKTAATSYYTTSRLPKNIGDSVSITLEEMLDKKMLIDFTDSNGKKCDLTNSYVKVTKMDEEYEMKVQLSCSDYSDYVIVYMGCYNYCDSAICQAKTTTTTTKNTTKPNTNNNNNSNTPTPVVNKQYSYEYRKVTQNEYSDWGNWSSWSTNSASSNNLTQVDMKTERVLSGYETETGIVDYNTKTTTSYVSKDVYTNTTDYDCSGTKQVSNTTTDTKTPTKTTSSSYYTNWTYQGYVTSSYALSTSVSSTSTTKYTYVSDKTTVNCNNTCKNVTTYTYKKYTRSYVSGGTKVTCPSGYSLNSAKTSCTKSVTTYTNVPVCKQITKTIKTTVLEPVKNTTSTPVYGDIQGDPIYRNVTYYRYRTRRLISEAGADYKWSSSDNDTSLTKQGYVLTGNKKEV